MRLVLFILLMCITNLGFTQTVSEVFAEAEAAFEKEDYKTALKKINYVMENDVPKLDYFFIKAYSQINLQNYQDAYDTFSQGIEVFPKDPNLYDGRGNLLIAYKKFSYAILDFTNAINLAESDTSKCAYLSNRSAAKMNVRDFEGAYDDLIMAYNIDSTDLGTLTNLGVVCDEIGRGDETLKYLLKAVDIDPDYYPAYANIGFKYQFMGEYEKSTEYYNKVLEYNPNEPLGYSNRSYNRLKLGDLKGAMKDINKSIKIYPANPYAYRNRALIYIEMGKMNKACEDLQTAIDKGFTGMYGNEVKELLVEYCD